ncbi:MAG TPA: MFS transporter [Kofleriaceae bacterium]|jgi:MFS family permease|nr:MFS transporter [Kofleriaceae bacterium]
MFTAAFLTVWAGQLVSIIGSGLTSFALGLWVLDKTGEVTPYAFILVITVVSRLLLAPVMGTLIDRWGARRSMILGDLVGAIATLGIAMLVHSDQIAVWHVYLLSFVSGAAIALRGPAFLALTTQLTPAGQLGRVNGLLQLAQSSSYLVSPMLATVLLGTVGLAWLIAIDVASYGVGLVTLLAVQTPVSAARARTAWTFHESMAGIRYVVAQPGLLGLLLFFFCINIATAMVQVLIIPMVRSIDHAVIGRVLTIAAVGMLLGSIAMSAWGGPRRRLTGVLGFAVLQGAMLSIAGLRPSIPLISASAFLYLFTFPLVAGCNEAFWMEITPEHLRGRVFAARGGLGASSLPLAYALAGPLTDRVFEPLLAPGGALAGSVGSLIGTGPGRGIGFLFMVFGVMVIVAAVTTYAYAPVRRYIIKDLA